MVYGYVSNLDNDTTKSIFRGKRIAENNIVPNYRLGDFVKCLQKGDVVYVMNVNRFDSVTQLLAFGRFCIGKGVSLRIIAQPYLDLTDGKVWKDSVFWQMEKMREVEMYAKSHIQKAFRMSNEQWEYLYRTIEVMNLEVLAHTFSPDGILKRNK